MNAQNRLPRDHPARRGSTPLLPRFVARRRTGHGWNSPLGRRSAASAAGAGAGQGPLEGKIHSPYSKAVSVPRRRGRWLTVGVPSVLGTGLGLGSFLLLGVSSLIGGAGLLAPLIAGLGIAVVVGGGTGLLLRNRAPQPVRLNRTVAGEIPSGTRTMLEKIVKDSRTQRRRLHRLRRGGPSPAVKQILHRTETLLLRIDALLGSAALQSRRASDEDMMLLEGMADRYIPELVDALESTVGFLSPATTDQAREQAVANLESIDEQLAVLGEGIDRIENDIVAGVNRSLDVHSEFLRTRFAGSHDDPLTDR